jgi:iron complex transport system substrate-binding protein
MSVIKSYTSRLIKSVLLITFTWLLVTGCSQFVTRPYLSFQPSSECRTIQHKFGETCIPPRPQRIIALDPRITLDPLIALGIKPVGYTSYGGKDKEVLLGVSLDEVKGSKNVGSPFQASLEKILMLKPDLILKTDYSDADQSYKLESAIAPTLPVPNESLVLEIDSKNRAYFKYNLEYIAKLLGQETKAEEVLRRYYKRIEELKKRLGDQVSQIEISVIFYGEGYIWTISKDDTISSILTDIGLNHKIAPHGNWNLSIETINEYDADILFIIDIDERASKFYLQNPMFRTLKAVKNNRAYVVTQQNWRGFGMSGANKILDDLFRYLPKDA